jgi:hypothetical protein
MALIESIIISSSNHLSSESKGNNKLEEAPPKIDPSTTKILQSTVSGSDELTDPSTHEHLRGVT